MLNYARTSFDAMLDESAKGSTFLSYFERVRIIPVIAIGLGAFLTWAWFSPLDEVVLGNGTVIPPMRAQLIQSLEGGIVDGLFVREGDVVEPKQKLASLDRTRFSSALGETQAKAVALEAAASRLEAEISGGAPQFSATVRAAPAIVARELKLLDSRRSNLRAATANLEQSLALVRRELRMTEPLVELGAANQVEVIRLQRQANEIEAELSTLRNKFVIEANTEFTRVTGELDQVRQVLSGREDQLSRTVLLSPVKGIVKDLEVSTIGGVIQPGGTLMEIVPMDNDLIVETRVLPKDIAFIRPGLPANVKISAYDSSIYGSLAGTVERISPDTLQDEVDRRLVYYRVDVRTERASLRTKDGKEHNIMPGMVATVEIKTGSKTVLEYLVKPINKAREAMRER